MSSVLIQNPLEAKISSNTKKSKKNTKKNNNKNENKENIPSNIQHKKLIEEEDIQSSKKLNIKDDKKIIDNSEKNDKISNQYFEAQKPKNLSKRAYEKFEEKIKERTMRIELDKIYNETERLKQEYEEKNMNYFLFDNPQFKKMVKVVEKQLYYILSLSILLNISNIFIANKLSKDSGGIS